MNMEAPEKKEYNQQPVEIFKTADRKILSFSTEVSNRNIDEAVVKSFGEEWNKFYEFSELEIANIGSGYFDIITDDIVNKSSYCIDIGCGTGRWSKYLHTKAAFIECIDPSDAIFVADKVLSDIQNVRLAKASTDNIPFDDGTFDFGMSVGVLHHIPDTGKALKDCVQKVKMNGYFYVYLYYALDNRGAAYKMVFFLVNAIRKAVSSLPTKLKKIVCDLIAYLIYLPIILIGRIIKLIGFRNLAKKLPLSAYHDRSFFVIRNDALDRFGTKLEQRFTKSEVIELMKRAGLAEITVSEKFPYWHAIGKRLHSA
jgi:2-polyprenyl-3-methyl-5-hydroxy-6-metoxy-1,4-benzoquinol methylase